MKSFFFIWAVFLLSSISYAQIDTKEQNFAESKSILGEIEKENYFKKGAIDIRSGLLQVSANKAADPIELNARSEMPFVEFSYERQIKNRWGVVGSFLHAQNALGKGTLNNTSAYLQSYQIGALYKIILDETMIKNYVTFKMQYYGMANNFKLVDPQAFFFKSESGFLLGVERTIPATELFDIRGSFDFIYITTASTENTTTDFVAKGNGLQMRADLFYNFTKTSRLGLGYGLSAFFNKFPDGDFEARDRHTQTYKALYLDYNYLF